MDEGFTSRRIARNTIYLYVRMFFVMAVSLYTSRVVLDVLGVDDYGIYNIVGSIVVLFSFLSNAITQSTQRYLTFELGKNNLEGFRRVFSLSFLIYLLIGGILLLLSEAIGVWFVNTQLNIAEDRMIAANWVFQLSIITFIVNMLRTPYNAAIISHERMSFYAYMGVLEVVLKLLLVFLLATASVDRLVLYAFLILSVSVILNITYYLFCRAKLKGCSVQWTYDSLLFKKLLSFSGWSMFGSMSVVATNQGINILFNIFNGVVVNAAMGVGNQVANAINQLVGNFQMAFNPQIVKLYAAEKKEELKKLINFSSKMSFFLLFVVAFPLLLEMEAVLGLWLTIVPDYAVSFCRILLVVALIDTLSGPLWMLVQANGNIRNYQIIISLVISLNFALVYLLLKLGYSPDIALSVRIIVSVMALCIRIIYLDNLLNVGKMNFLHKVLFPIILVVMIAGIGAFGISSYTEGLIAIIISAIFAFLVVIIWGLNKEEKKLVFNLLHK